MSISSEMTSIGENLLADYEALENIGAELENVDKNIENIAAIVNGIYDNLPKTTGENSNLSLTTLKGKMNIIPKGDTSQYSTNGYQLLEIPTNQSITSNGVTFSFDDKGILTISGKNTATNLYLTLSNSTPVAGTSVNDMYTYAKSISNGQYKLSTIYFSGTKTSGTMTCNVRKYGESAIVGVNVASETTRNNFEISTTGNYVTYLYIAQNIEFTNFKMGFMISSGTTNRDYEQYTGGITSPNPTYPQDIEVVTGTQDVKVENKNLFDKTNYEQGYSYTSGSKVANTNWGIYYLTCNANETYTISGLKAYSGAQIVQLDSSKNIISVLQTRTTANTFTITSTQVGYIGISFVWSTTPSLGSELDTIQIEKRKYCNYLCRTSRTNTSSRII